MVVMVAGSRDRSGDLEFDEPVVVQTELAQHVVSVFGELWSP
jgi:hypothetical protein